MSDLIRAAEIALNTLSSKGASNLAEWGLEGCYQVLERALDAVGEELSVHELEGLVARLRAERDQARFDTARAEEELSDCQDRWSQDRARVARLIETARAALDWPWKMDDPGEPEYAEYAELDQAVKALTAPLSDDPTNPGANPGPARKDAVRDVSGAQRGNPGEPWAILE